LKNFNLIKGLLVILITANFISAQSKQPSLLPPMDGDLDTTFNGSGIVTTGFGFGSDSARSTAIQPDNKIIAVGPVSNGTDNDFGLARYNTNGSLDATFGIGGKMSTAIGPNQDYASSVAIQSDGKIVVVGDSHDGTKFNFAVARYKPNGSLDTSFGTGGIVTTSFGTITDSAQSVAVQTDGKIVVSGYSHNGTTGYVFATARYNTNGSLDVSFGSSGKRTTKIGPGTTAGSNQDYAYSLLIQPDGKIVVGGSSYNGSKFDFALLRYNSNGSLDGTFGVSGIVTNAIASSTDEALSIAIQTDGSIVAVGYTVTGPHYDFAVARYKPNGILDSAFDGDGIVTSALGSSFSEATSVVIQTSGKIVVGGLTSNGVNLDFAVVRYNSDGSLDNSFASLAPSAWGTGGLVTVDVSVGGNDGGAEVRLDSFGRVIVAGNANNSFGVVRLYSPLAPTAANANLGGKVVTERGRGISNVKVTLTNQNGEVRYANTNQFGYFNFYDLPSGELYIVTVASKLYQFNQNSQTIQLDENFDGLSFVGSLR
jgi:uncharacterized delta-60 repeat protein